MCSRRLEEQQMFAEKILNEQMIDYLDVVSYYKQYYFYHRSKMLIIVALFTILANLKQLFNKKILFLKIVGICKKYCLNFQSLQDRLFFVVFFYFFLFSIYKTVDIIDVYKSLNISTGTVMKSPEVLKFVPDHLKTKKLCKHTVKKLP